MDEDKGGNGKEFDDGDQDEDIDLYEDLETGGSDANANSVFGRFSKFASPQKRISEDDVIDGNGDQEEDDVGLYDDLNSFDKQLKADEVNHTMIQPTPTKQNVNAHSLENFSWKPKWSFLSRNCFTWTSKTVS